MARACYWKAGLRRKTEVERGIVMDEGCQKEKGDNRNAEDGSLYI